MIFEIKISYILGHNSILTYSELFWMVRFFFEVYIKLLNGVSCECLNTPVSLFFYSIFVCNVQYVALITFQKKSSNISSSSDGTFLLGSVDRNRAIYEVPLCFIKTSKCELCICVAQRAAKLGRSILKVWKKSYNLDSIIWFF